MKDIFAILFPERELSSQLVSLPVLELPGATAVLKATPVVPEMRRLWCYKESFAWRQSRYKLNLYFQGHITHIVHWPAPGGTIHTACFVYVAVLWACSSTGLFVPGLNYIFFLYFNYFIHSINIYWALFSTRDHWTETFSQEAYLLVGFPSIYNIKPSNVRQKNLFNIFACFTSSDLIVWCIRGGSWWLKVGKTILSMFWPIINHWGNPSAT